MSRVWFAEAITLVALGGLGIRWWREYRRTDARSWVHRLRAWRLFGLGLVLIGLVTAALALSLGCRSYWLWGLWASADALWS